MSDDEETQYVFNEEDHQVSRIKKEEKPSPLQPLTHSQAAYVFDPDEEAPKERPSKRRRVSKKGTSSSRGGEPDRSLFVPLMDGTEREESVRGRERLFEECWSRVEARIKVWLGSLGGVKEDGGVLGFVLTAE